MFGISKSGTTAFILGLCACLAGNTALAQLEVTEEAGPYSYHVYGPNSLGDTGAYGPAGGTPETGYGYFIWHADANSSTTSTHPMVPWHINDAGAAAGRAGGHAAIWQDGVITDLHLLLGLPTGSGTGSHAIGLSSSGIVGIAAWSYDGQSGYLWSEVGGGVQVALPDYAYAPRFMNELGEVTGQCRYPDTLDYCAYFWSQDTGYIEIFTANVAVYPVAINDRSEVVGYAWMNDPVTGSNTRTQWYWRLGEEAQVFASGLGQVIGINNLGTVLGWEAERKDGGYLWNADTGFLQRNIMLPGSTDTRRLHLNDLDFVAGTAFQLYVGKKNFLWTPTYGYQVIDEEIAQDIEGMKGLYIVAEGMTRYTIVLPPATPEEVVEDLVEDIAILAESGSISSGDEASLTSKLDSATALLSEDRIGPACNMLDAYVKQIEARVRSGSMDPATGAELIAPVESLEECASQ